jgi:short-subunit dehydrogenase involved in D-alanine esterification of teichoic acids
VSSAPSFDQAGAKKTCDVADPTAASALVTSIVLKHRRINVLRNNVVCGAA